MANYEAPFLQITYFNSVDTLSISGSEGGGNSCAAITDDQPLT
jgi:hypothetical protein